MEIETIAIILVAIFFAATMIYGTKQIIDID